MSRIGDAIRRKYRTVEGALRALGFDEALIAELAAEAERPAMDRALGRALADWPGRERSPKANHGSHLALDTRSLLAAIGIAGDENNVRRGTGDDLSAAFANGPYGSAMPEPEDPNSLRSLIAALNSLTSMKIPPAGHSLAKEAVRRLLGLIAGHESLEDAQPKLDEHDAARRAAEEAEERALSGEPEIDAVDALLRRLA